MRFMKTAVLAGVLSAGSLVFGTTPAKAPEVVLVVLVERGGKGGQVAAPIARKILNAIFYEKVAAVEVDG